jgi:multicomponent K+:H+ antiporter subunit E
MRRWLPFPLLTATLLAVWLLLNESVAPGSIILGGVLAFAAVRVRAPEPSLGLALMVLADVVRSNIAVASIILNPGTRKRTSGFVRIPLDMRAPYGLTALACIITATPGTLWVEYDSAQNTILLHILDLVDERVWIETIKGRYERRLMEVFE